MCTVYLCAKVCSARVRRTIGVTKGRKAKTKGCKAEKGKSAKTTGLVSVFNGSSVFLPSGPACYQCFCFVVRRQANEYITDGHRLSPCKELCLLLVNELLCFWSPEIVAVMTKKKWSFAEQRLTLLSRGEVGGIAPRLNTAGESVARSPGSEWLLKQVAHTN